MSNDQQTYEELLYDYRKTWKEERRADLHADRAQRQFYFVERNRIHERLREVAARMGKSPADITIDLLASEDNLKEYNLPEFRMLRTRDAFEEAAELSVALEDGKKDVGSTKLASEKYAVFIPFGQREFWHLFDHESYAFHRPDDIERHRRARRVAELTDGMARVADLHSSETFHRATTLFGIVCSSKDAEHVLQKMEKYRSEISIDAQFMDEARVRADFTKNLQKDIDYIFGKEHGPHEDSQYLVRRLLEYVRDHAKLPSVYLQDAIRVLEEAVRRAEREEHELDLERAGEESVRLLDEAERDYPNESLLPKYSSR